MHDDPCDNYDGAFDGPKPADGLERRARELTRELHTNGSGQEGIRLVITDARNRDLGGWSDYVVRGKLLEALRAVRAEAIAEERKRCLHIALAHEATYRFEVDSASTDTEEFRCAVRVAYAATEIVEAIRKGPGDGE